MSKCITIIHTIILNIHTNDAYWDTYRLRNGAVGIHTPELLGRQPLHPHCVLELGVVCAVCEVCAVWSGGTEVRGWSDFARRFARLMRLMTYTYLQHAQFRRQIGIGSVLVKAGGHETAEV
jgi:hypothetical protein